MIRSWRNSASRKVWEGERPNALRGLDFEAATDLLLALNVAKSLQDLSPLRSVGLHKLKGDRKSQWAMTVNERWRICFEFRKGDAFDVEIVDYQRINHGPRFASGPPAQTSASRTLALCQPALARHRRAVRPHHRYSQRSTLDHR